MSGGHAVAVLAAGYSIGAALVLALTHFRGEAYRRQTTAQAAGLFLLAALALLQAIHAAVLLGAGVNGAAAGLPYRVALFVVAPAFYLSSRPLLDPQREVRAGPAALHALPVALAVVLPAAAARPLAFAIGAVYLLALGRTLYALRSERLNFRREAWHLGLAFAIAAGVALLGVFPPLIDASGFVAAHALAIGLAFLLVQVVLATRPALPEEVRETAQAAYVQTTLGKVDCRAAIERLEGLMRDERLYTDPDLDLEALAARLDLSPHQLSELLNVQLGRSFARFLREYRVAAACERLLSSPTESVLSVGLEAGFATQSTFYEAFREIEGTTPGQYRKLNRPKRSGGNG